MSRASSSPDPGAGRGAARAVALLTLVNLLNYVDRNVLAPLLPQIQSELGLSNAAAGTLATAFILVYAVTSPLFGWGGDRGVRKRWLAAGVALWSLATSLAGLARSFASLFAARAAVGIGEAAYGTIAPALLADYVPHNRRGGVMAIFSLAIPVGTALGYLLGGVLGERVGWRGAFLAVGVPGLALAAALLFLREPERGILDAAAERGRVALRDAYAELWRNRVYVWTVLGYAAYTFAIGGLAVWAPSYILRVRGLPPEQSMLVFGAITISTGLAGTLLGGLAGDKLQDRTRNGYTLLNVATSAAGAVLTLAALLAADIVAFFVLLALGELLLFASTGPVNALIVNTVRPGIRATASATAILAIHLLGDVLSPPIIGLVADATDLATALLAVPVFFFAASALWLVTWRRR